MSGNRIKLFKQMVDEAGLEIVDFIGNDANTIKAHCKVPGFDETRLFMLTMKQGDPRGDKNELARMKRFFREMKPEPYKGTMADQLTAIVSEFKHVAKVAPPPDWDTAAFGPKPLEPAPEPEAPAPEPEPEPTTSFNETTGRYRTPTEESGYASRPMPVRLTTRQQATLRRLLIWFDKEFPDG